MKDTNSNNKNGNTNAYNVKQNRSHIQKVRQLVQILNTGNLENLDGLIHPEYFNHESQVDISSIKDIPKDVLQKINMRNDLRGPAEFVDTVKNLRNAFTDLKYEEKEIYSDNYTVISHFVVSGKHTGYFFAFAPTGNSFRYKTVHIHRFEQDKIKEHKAIRDDLTFMLQLGIVVPNKKYESLFNSWKRIERPQ